MFKKLTEGQEKGNKYNKITDLNPNYIKYKLHTN